MCFFISYKLHWLFSLVPSPWGLEVKIQYRHRWRTQSLSESPVAFLQTALCRHKPAVITHDHGALNMVPWSWQSHLKNNSWFYLEMQKDSTRNLAKSTQKLSLQHPWAGCIGGQKHVKVERVVYCNEIRAWNKCWAMRNQELCAELLCL